MQIQVLIVKAVVEAARTAEKESNM